MSDEIVLPYPEPILPVRHVRGTLLIGSLASIKEAGHFEAYARNVPAETLATIDSCVGAMWIPLEVAHAHYRACDALGLSADSAYQLGRGTFARTKGLLLGTATALARGAGASPWTFIPHLQRFWLRGNDGGGIRALRKGPKEIALDVASCGLASSRYYRAGLRGVTTSVLELVSRKVYMRELPTTRPDSVAFRVQWV